MLILGSRGAGAFGRMALGSVSQYAAAHASCPVIVLRGEAATVHRHVGIGIGDLDLCADSLAFAFEEASLRRAGVLAVHALHVPVISPSWPSALDLGADEADAARQLAERLDTYQDKYPEVPVSAEVVPGPPGQRLDDQFQGQES